MIIDGYKASFESRRRDAEQSAAYFALTDEEKEELQRFYLDGFKRTADLFDSTASQIPKRPTSIDATAVHMPIRLNYPADRRNSHVWLAEFSTQTIIQNLRGEGPRKIRRIRLFAPESSIDYASFTNPDSNFSLAQLHPEVTAREQPAEIDTACTLPLPPITRQLGNFTNLLNDVVDLSRGLEQPSIPDGQLLDKVGQ
jgi:hypothetical protein